MPKLYLLVGVPGSGKSTWIVKQEWAKDCHIASTDNLVEEYASSVGSTYSAVFQAYMPTAVKLMREQIRSARKTGKDIIWDQTNTSELSRRKKLRSLKDYYKIAVVIQTPEIEELRKRLASRPGKAIPWRVVSSMAKQLQNEPPTKDEGFDEIWIA